MRDIMTGDKIHEVVKNQLIALFYLSEKVGNEIAITLIGKL